MAKSKKGGDTKSESPTRIKEDVDPVLLVQNPQNCVLKNGKFVSRDKITGDSSEACTKAGKARVVHIKGVGDHDGLNLNERVLSAAIRKALQIKLFPMPVIKGPHLSRICRKPGCADMTVGQVLHAELVSRDPEKKKAPEIKLSVVGCGDSSAPDITMELDILSVNAKGQITHVNLIGFSIA